MSLTVSPRPGVGSRAIAFTADGIAVVQALSSRKLAFKILRLARSLGFERAVSEVMVSDPKGSYRQAIAVGMSGGWGAFTGFGTAPEKGHKREGNLFCAGNGLKRGVLRAMCSIREPDPLKAVFLAALEAESAGGNLWSSRSASLVILGKGAIKLDVHSSDDPVFDMMTKARRVLARPPSPLY